MPRSQGKVVVVNFWATWCVPCIREIPGFNRLNDELAEAAWWWWVSPWMKTGAPRWWHRS